MQYIKYKHKYKQNNIEMSITDAFKSIDAESFKLFKPITSSKVFYQSHQKNNFPNIKKLNNSKSITTEHKSTDEFLKKIKNINNNYSISQQNNKIIPSSKMNIYNTILQNKIKDEKFDSEFFNSLKTKPEIDSKSISSNVVKQKEHDNFFSFNSKVICNIDNNKKSLRERIKEQKTQLDNSYLIKGINEIKKLSKFY